MRERRGEKKIFFSFLFVGATVSFLGGSALHEFDAALPLRSNGVTTVASSVFFSRFRGRKREDDAAGVGARAVPVKKRGGRRGEEEEVVVVVVLWGRSRAFDAAGVTTIVRRTWVKSRRPIRNHLCGACLFRSLLLTTTRLFLLLHRLRSPAHRDARVVSTGPFLFCSLFSLLRSAVFPTRMSPKRTTDCNKHSKNTISSPMSGRTKLSSLCSTVSCESSRDLVTVEARLLNSLRSRFVFTTNARSQKQGRTGRRIRGIGLQAASPNCRVPPRTHAFSTGGGAAGRPAPRPRRRKSTGYLVDPASSICLSQRLSHACLSTSR